MSSGSRFPTWDETIERAVDAIDGVLEPLDATEALEPLIEPIADAADDVLDAIDDVVPIPEPLDPRETWRKINDAIDWVDEHFGPVADPIGDTLDPQLPVDDGPTDDTPVDDSGGWDLIDWTKFLLLVNWLSEQEAALDFDVNKVIAVYDSRWFDTLEGLRSRFGESAEATTSVYTAPGPFAARLGDIAMHGDPIAPGTGSASVLIGGRPALRLCDSHICTKATPAPHTPLGFRSAYNKVLVNGFPALRMGDFVDEGPAGPNPIVSGCASVTIGPTPPPVTIVSTPADEAEPASIIPFDWERIHYGDFTGTVTFGVNSSGPFARVKGTNAALRIWAEETVSVNNRPIWDFDGDGRPLAFRTVVKKKTERAFGVTEIEMEIGKKPGKPKVTLKPNEEKEPEYVPYYEFVEVDPE